MGDLDVQLGSEVEVLGVVENQIALQGHNRMYEELYGLEAELTLPELLADVEYEHDSVVGVEVGLQSLLEGQLVDDRQNLLELCQE